MVSKSIFLLFLICIVYSQSATIEEEANNSTSFTLAWYRSSFDANKNLVVSPLSFRILLSLLYQSASGDTETELKNNLHFSEKDETAISQRLTLDKLIASPSLKVVNRIYVKKGNELSKSLVTNAHQYHSAIEQKDFTKSQETANEINQFVEEQTNNLIKDLVSKQDFGPDTALLLLNTLYFKANWATEFDESDVSKYNFKGIDGEKYLIPYMTGTRSFKTFNSTSLKALTLEIPYVSNSNAKFWIILPNEDSNITELKEKLEPVAITEIYKKLVVESNSIIMPKFEIESDINGIQELKKLGLNSMFDKTEVDVFEGGPKLKVSDAKQKAKIIVSTKGTEAVAATIVKFVAISGIEYIKPPIVFDRPFIYMILTEDTNEPLFIGHFSKPN